MFPKAMFQSFNLALVYIDAKVFSYYSAIYIEECRIRLESQSPFKAYLVECSVSIAAKIKETSSLCLLSGVTLSKSSEY